MSSHIKSQIVILVSSSLSPFTTTSWTANSSNSLPISNSESDKTFYSFTNYKIFSQFITKYLTSSCYQMPWCLCTVWCTLIEHDGRLQSLQSCKFFISCVSMPCIILLVSQHQLVTNAQKELIYIKNIIQNMSWILHMYCAVSMVCTVDNFEGLKSKKLNYNSYNTSSTPSPTFWCNFRPQMETKWFLQYNIHHVLLNPVKICHMWQKMHTLQLCCWRTIACYLLKKHIFSCGYK
jgi:hypothetical protein